jgi:cellulose synthase/poly-beta-1,6-N-acetylglucosamine synthase-like glycosyltransferase
MNLQIEQILLVVVLLFWFDIIIVLRTLYNKTKLGIAKAQQEKELSEMSHLFDIKGIWDKKKTRRLFSNYLFMKQSINLPEEERLKILSLAKADKIEPTLARKIRSFSRYRRMEAATGLALIANDSSRRILEKALLKEKDFPTRLYIASALGDVYDPRSLGVLVESLLGTHYWYRNKVNMIIASYGMIVSEYLKGMMWRDDIEIQELLIDIAGTCICGELEEYLMDIIDRGPAEMGRLGKRVQGCKDKSCIYCTHGVYLRESVELSCKYKGIVVPSFKCRRFKERITRREPVVSYHRLMVRAAETLEKYYAPRLFENRFLSNDDKEIRKIAVRALGKGSEAKNVEMLVSFLEDESVLTQAQIGLSEILSAHPRLVPSVLSRFSATNGVVHERIAEVLSGRIEFFIGRLLGKESGESETVIREVLRQGRYSEVIEFLNHNGNIELENAVVGIVKSLVPEHPDLERECGLYLDERILAKAGIAKVVPELVKRVEKRDKKMIFALYMILAVAVSFFPLLYIIRYSGQIYDLPLIHQLKTYIVDFNTDFAWYSITVNVVYIVLLLMSAMKVRTSTRLWDRKTMSFLFKPRILPSISIIAPAFNEEKTIIESANSLLNLKYPDYELLVVNDGSRDSTLATLIDYFKLKRTDYHFNLRLKHKSIRGIYANPILPRLIVVDKENGGKADSLNAGINISSKEYFCGIDADSLLEPDSLLKIASLTLDYGVETPAIGGNVFPINGCSVDKGKLTKIALPKNNLAKLQTTEYLRAFMCGRLGWTQVNALLIISGAFGLFRKERVIATGGYMTSSERFQKDTVGEDMELIVRITRLMREKRQNYRVGYAYNANCWTEVPEDLKSLQKQRNRWHRGLIDIMYFHRKLIFNPSYGRMGLVGMPYYLIFEMIGPLFEIQGYFMVFLAAMFGLLSTKLALLLFVSTIFMGVMISMAAVLIAERQISYFNYRETLKILGMALIENFGPRQVFSMWRVLGFLNAMRKPQGWGKLERKGFAAGLLFTSLESHLFNQGSGQRDGTDSKKGKKP